MYHTVGPWPGQNIHYSTSTDAINWDYPGIKVLEHGTDDWEISQVFNFSIIKNDGSYEMWYTGGDSIGITEIGHAVSEDGINWVKNTELYTKKRLIILGGS